MTLWRKRQIEIRKQEKEKAMRDTPSIFLAIVFLLLMYALAGYFDEESEKETEQKCFISAGYHPAQRVQVPCEVLK